MFPAARWQAANFPHHRLDPALCKIVICLPAIRAHARPLEMGRNGQFLKKTRAQGTIVAGQHVLLILNTAVHLPVNK
jgi:hypothetical protein